METPGGSDEARLLHYNNRWQASKCQVVARKGGGEPIMEEIPLAFLQALSQTPVPLELAEDALKWEVELVTEDELSCRETSFWSKLRRRLVGVSQCFRSTLNRRRGRCPSCTGLLRATRESDGPARTLHGVPHVEPIRTELFLMELLTTTASPSRQESWSPRLPRSMTMRFGNRLGLLHLSSQATCSCPESGTP